MGCTNSMTRVESKQYITVSQRQVVRRTWKYLESDMTGIGSKVFLRIFQLNPHIKKLFPCRDKEGVELLQDSNFKGHASRFMQAVGAVVDNMDDLDLALTPLLVGLGRQHIHFRGFVPDDFDAFSESMTMVWSLELRGKFTNEVKTAWASVFNFIMMKLKEGFALATEEEKTNPAKMPD